MLPPPPSRQSGRPLTRFFSLELPLPPLPPSVPPPSASLPPPFPPSLPLPPSPSLSLPLPSPPCLISDPAPIYRANPRYLRKISILGTGCCCPKKKSKKNFNFWHHALRKNRFRNKNRQNKLYFAPTPLFARMPDRRRDAVCAPLLVAPPPPLRVSCPILHLALLSENDESGTTNQGIQDCHKKKIKGLVRDI